MDIYADNMTMLALWLMHEALKFDIESILFYIKWEAENLIE